MGLNEAAAYEPIDVYPLDTCPADELPTIFDEYRQAEGSESSVQKGTGLGLSITKKFAELLGGTIGVESEVGKGSTFTVRVPVEYREPTRYSQFTNLHDHCLRHTLPDYHRGTATDDD